ncbi:MAG: hypothetical protein ACLPX9_17270, partial [Rhodomicrobium sp.]
MLAVNHFCNPRFGFVVNARNNLILTGILEGAVYIYCSGSCQGCQEAALRADVIAFVFEQAAP